jgi:hypothetical protein
MNDCYLYQGQTNTTNNGVQIDLESFSIEICNTATHRIMDVDTYNEIMLTSTYSSDEIIAILFPPVDLTATFAMGFIAVFGLAMAAYKIKVAKNLINKM